MAMFTCTWVGWWSLMEIFGDCCNGVFYRLYALCFAYATVSK